MPVESIRGVVEAAIQSASNATGVDFGFLMGTAKRESGYDPGAKAPTGPWPLGKVAARVACWKGRCHRKRFSYFPFDFKSKS